MYILGISCFYHDSAAVLLNDGQIIAAVQEERFSRKKHDSSFPKKSIEYCFNKANISSAELDYVGFYEKPFIKFERLILSYLETAPRGLFSFLQSMPLWMKDKLWTKYVIQKELGWDKEIVFIPHHLSHAASAFFASPFDSAAILTIDGVGEWSTATRGIGSGNTINLTHEIRYPDSLGLLYSAFTYYCGFKVNSSEYKLMGLAPYGKPIYVDLIKKHFIKVFPDGSFKLNMKYFSYEYGLQMINNNFIKLFDNNNPRDPKEKLTQYYKDVAASVQRVLEEVVLLMIADLHEKTKEKNLCIAGGVALNCVVNGRIIRESQFSNLFVQPAAGDAGGALGVALFIYNAILNNPRKFVMEHVYCGPEYSNYEIEDSLNKLHIKYKKYSSESRLIKEVALRISKQRVIGWFQGKMEWGPRALGNRSILADPRNPKNQHRVNMKIKYREDFRPFAPSVLEGYNKKIFNIDRTSPFMLLVADVNNKHRDLPSITHVNGSARIHSVAKKTNPKYWKLLEEFRRLTGCPVLINTSFNVRGEPIVCSPEDAINCFLGTDMDDVVLGNYLISKEYVKIKDNHKSHRYKFAPD